MGKLLMHFLSVVLLLGSFPLHAQVLDPQYDWRSKVFGNPAFVQYSTSKVINVDPNTLELFFESELYPYVPLYPVEASDGEVLVFPLAPTFLISANFGTSEVYGSPSFAGGIFAYNDFRYAAVEFRGRDGEVIGLFDGSTYITDAIYLASIPNFGRALVLWFPAGAIVGACVAFLFNWLLLLPSIVR